MLYHVYIYIVKRIINEMKHILHFNVRYLFQIKIILHPNTWY